MAPNPPETNPRPGGQQASFRPSIYGTEDPLPFGELSAGQFSRLCLSLVRCEGYLRAQYVGARGKDQGRDVVAYKPVGLAEQLWYFRCQRQHGMGAKALKDEVDEIAIWGQIEFGKRPFGIVFITDGIVLAGTRDKVEAYCRQHGYVCEFRAHSELDLLVKAHPEIVSEFFQVTGFARSRAAGPSQLPAPPEVFVGRHEDLEELLAAADKGGATISSARGLDGIGKTALALVLAEKLTPKYADAQIYVDLKGASGRPLSTAEAMSHVIRAYHPEAKLPEGEAELAGLYQSVLQGKRAILLMDNAREVVQVRPLIPPKGCLFLVTSRWYLAVPGVYAKNLDVLPAQEAEELLLRIAPRVADSVGRLAELCGRLPLALWLAGSLLAGDGGLVPQAYARQLQEERADLERNGIEAPEACVRAALALSYRRLAPDAARVFRRAAVFPGSFDAAAAETVCEDFGHCHMDQLVRLHLAEWDPPARRYRLHDRVRVFAAERLRENPEERDGVQLRHAKHYAVALAVAETLYLKGDTEARKGLQVFDLERANIETSQAWAAAHWDRDHRAAALCNAFPDVGSHCLALRLYPLERVRWLVAALAAARRLKNRKSEGVYLGNLGNAHAAMGETHLAIRFYEQQLTIAREIGVRRAEGNALGSLGNAYSALGETRKAIDFYEQHLAVAREIGDKRSERDALCNLGVGYAFMGEIRRAMEAHEQRLAIAREIGDRRSEGSALGSLGNAHYLLDQTGRAIELYEQRLAIARELDDTLAEGNALWNLSLALDRLGQREQAVRYARQALRAYDMVEDPNSAKVRKKLAEWVGDHVV